MPTDEDVEKAACVDGGQLLHQLMEGPPAAYRAFLDSHPTQLDKLSLQPVERAVDHLCHFLLRTVCGAGASSNAVLKPLTRAVVKKSQPGELLKGRRRSTSSVKLPNGSQKQLDASSSTKSIAKTKQALALVISDPPLAQPGPVPPLTETLNPLHVEASVTSEHASAEPIIAEQTVSPSLPPPDPLPSSSAMPLPSPPTPELSTDNGFCAALAASGES
uniref:Uncharacterized protein n=1 Tax=Haptolina ericina TaxID=156174 RepID=A0A7S3B058_9EUKA